MKEMSSYLRSYCPNKYTVEVDMKNIPETSQPPFVANMGWKEEIREERGR